jgi:tetratricopeptide (TPR) repeat protein
MSLWLGIFGFLVAAAATIVVLFLFWPDVLIRIAGGAPGAVEQTPEQVRTADQAIIEQLKFLLGGLALGLTAIVLIQTVFQARHDRIQNQSVDQVSNIMTVVKDILEGRLGEDRKAWADRDTAKRQLEEFQAQVAPIARRIEQQDAIIAAERRGIEALAEELAETSRHRFRDNVEALAVVAIRFDTFKAQFEPMEEPKKNFSARVLYIRGAAAHYRNDPTRAIEYLTEVTQMPSGAEDAASVKRRLANAYYYLGVAHANFNHANEAVDALTQAIVDRDRGDYLTRVVFAEAIAAVDPATVPTDVRKFVDPEAIADDILADRRAMRDDADPIYRYIRSRALVVRANTAIHGGDLAEAKDFLQRLGADHGDYYFATMTLAQVLAHEGSPQAPALFDEAYELIRASGNLTSNLTEVRSRILLHMSAALCLRHGGSHDTRHSEDHLHTARSLISRLPRLGRSNRISQLHYGEVCTVFSVLTKRNESPTSIEHHINEIRAGKVLEPAARPRSGGGAAF